MVDGAKPQPPQTFKPVEFLVWVKKRVALAKELISCYEAGPTGFWMPGFLRCNPLSTYSLQPTDSSLFPVMPREL